MLPFSQAQFFDMFARYNDAIWPAQVAAYLIAAVALGGAFSNSRAGAKLALTGLAVLWAWTGAVYHGLFFAEINPAGPAFGALFVVQAFIFSCYAARSPLRMHHAGARQATGLAMIVYAAIVYPLLNEISGRGYPYAPSFGVTPCPLVIFTFGALLFINGRASWLLLAAPIVWSIIGGSAAVLLNVYPDWALPVSAVTAIALNARAKPDVRAGFNP